MIDIKGKHIVIAGGARSGVAAAILMKEHGAEPFLSDFETISQSHTKLLDSKSIRYEQGKHSEEAMTGEFLVLSPGVPSTSPIAKRYVDDGKSIFSEIEVAGWFNKSPIIAVTGSNGKTSVTNWLAHTWKLAGRDYIIGGNIGTAFSDQVKYSAPDKEALLEVSSFQLDHIDAFKPFVSMVLNITPDHLDRYQNDFNRYTRSKLSITKNQGPDDWFIYNYDDPILADHAKKLSEQKSSPRIMAFSNQSEVPSGAFIRDENLILKINNKEENLMQIGEIGLPGQHNLKNGMATALAARANEIRNEYIRESLRSFEGVEHRLELVRTLDGVRYVNDSKATNINAVWYALDSFSMPVVLILGGRDKGNDYTELASQIREKVHTVVAIGEAAKAIKTQLKDVVPNLVESSSMKAAVKQARRKAKRGEIVLLSPACSSFDMFEDYKDRGNQFKQAVLEL